MSKPTLTERAIVLWRLRESAHGAAPPEAPAPTARSPASTFDAIERELRFMAHHHRRFRPDLRYVTPPEHIEAPVGVDAEPWLTRGAAGFHDTRWLSRLGRAGGPTELDAISLLRSVRGTARELPAVEHALRARPADMHTPRAPPPAKAR